MRNPVIRDGGQRWPACNCTRVRQHAGSRMQLVQHDRQQRGQARSAKRAANSGTEITYGFHGVIYNTGSAKLQRTFTDLVQADAHAEIIRGQRKIFSEQRADTQDQKISSKHLLPENVIISTNLTFVYAEHLPRQSLYVPLL